MATQKNAGLIQNLERSCGEAPARQLAADGWVRSEPAAGGIERMEMFFHGRAYAPHRHDVYATGVTTAGVQCFDYRGEARRSLAGQAIVLHPDELHDGAAGTEDGLEYRMVYVDPALIGEALGGRALPFVANGVSEDKELCAAVRSALADFGEPTDELRRTGMVSQLADALEAASDGDSWLQPVIDRKAVARTRAFLSETVDDHVDNTDLEAVSGLDRWTLARQFRSAYGTSPYRYFVMRRLDRARALIAAGTELAEAALAAGFADQSHMTRQFTRAYGMPPGRWARFCGAR